MPLKVTHLCNCPPLCPLPNLTKCLSGRSTSSVTLQLFSVAAFLGNLTVSWPCLFLPKRSPPAPWLFLCLSPKRTKRRSQEEWRRAEMKGMGKGQGDSHQRSVTPTWGPRPELRVRAPTLKSWVWQHTPITPGLRMWWRQGDSGVCWPVNELQGQWESLSGNKVENNRGRYLVLASGFTLHVLPHACTHMNIHAHEKTEGDRHSWTLLPFCPSPDPFFSSLSYLPFLLASFDFGGWWQKAPHMARSTWEVQHYFTVSYTERSWSSSSEKETDLERLRYCSI